MSVLRLIASNSYLTVNKHIIKEVGLEGAVMLAELASINNYMEEHDMMDESGMFFATAEHMEESTGLTAYQQSKAIKQLEEKGVIITCRKGLPAKKFFSINEAGISALFQNKFSKNLKTRVKETSKQEPQFFENINNNRKNNNRGIRIDEKVELSKLSDPVKEKVTEFLAYRVEIKKPFKSDKGLQSFINQVEKQEAIHGASAVIECIDTSMQNGWQGVFWDRIKQPKSKLEKDFDMIDRWAANYGQQNQT